MSTLNFIITDAGRQAAINADATGVQLTITEVGYGTGQWTPGSSATALQSEFKRLVAGGGENPAPLYVHIAVTDQSSDTYQANEIGIYAGNVLFAVWSKGLQPSVDGPGKISTQDSAFVFDLLLDNVPPDSVTVGDANFSNPLATETVYGVTREATDAEIAAGEKHGIFVPPAGLEKWFYSIVEPIWLRQLWTFGTDDLPDDFPGFIHNGQIVPNGWVDYPKLANSGYKYVSRVNANDMLIHDLSDFVRGQGSSGRQVGDFQDFQSTPYDDVKIDSSSYGAFRGGPLDGQEAAPSPNTSQVTIDRVEHYYRDEYETRPNSDTFLFACYHGEPV